MSKMINLIKDNQKRTELFLSISAIALFIGFFNIGNLPVDVSWVVIILCGLPIIWGAISALVRDFDIKADLLVSIAIVSSIFIDEVFAAATVAFIMTIGAYLESKTVAKARKGIERLSKLRPTEARLIVDNMESNVPVDQIRVGDKVRVLAGETIVVDGTILSGHASINQSIMTGESLPVDKCPGDMVMSGTVSCFGSFDMLAEKVGEDSSIQKMIRLVESSDPGKAKIVREADRWATWIVVTAIFFSVMIYAFTKDISRSVTILVVFCPCAFVLATPTAIMASIGNAARCGILVGEGDAMERLSTVKRMVFDKTGTITCGHPIVTEIISTSDDFGPDTILEMAASSELMSEHPLGKSIVSKFKECTGSTPKEPKCFELIPGCGVISQLDYGETIIGNSRMMQDHHVYVPAISMDISRDAMEKGSTLLYVAVNGNMVGIIVMNDVIRQDASKMVDELKTSGLSVTLLTGDNAASANHIASQTSIEDAISDCLPEDKLRYIREKEILKEPICMIGDGVNDAAALKSARVGIAMGMGSDIAIDCADIVLTGNDISKIPHLFDLSCRTMKIIRFNLTLAFGINIFAMILAIFGIIGPIAGALIHNIGSVFVIGCSATLLKWKAKEEFNECDDNGTSFGIANRCDHRGR
jgi:heavy metal translocating P-type ATPase